MTNAQLRHSLWQSAKIPNDYRYHPSVWRLDPLGRLIYWFAYGNKSHPNGWDIGHLVSKASGGADEISNLQAEHHSTTAQKQQIQQWFDQQGKYHSLLSVYGVEQPVQPFIGNVRPL